MPEAHFQSNWFNFDGSETSLWVVAGAVVLVIAIVFGSRVINNALKRRTAIAELEKQKLEVQRLELEKEEVSERRGDVITRDDFEKYKAHIKGKFEQNHEDHEALGNKIDTLGKEVETRFGVVEKKLVEIGTILGERLPKRRVKK